MTEPSTEARITEPPTETWDVAVVGAGYVGVPLAQLLAGSGKSVLLVDISQRIVDGINRGESHIEDVPSETLRPFVEEGRISATTDYDGLGDADAIVVCLPTPLSKQREPDIRILQNAVTAIAERLRPGHLVVLESTTYPGTTREVVLAAARVERARGRQGLQPRLLPGTGRPRQHEVAAAERPEDRRRDHRGVHRASRRPLPGRDRPGASSHVARGGRADEAAREHLPLRQHRARQRARAALRPDADRRLGGRRRGRRPSRSASCASSPDRASAATASRSTPSTSRGRRGSSASTRSSSSSRAR